MKSTTMTRNIAYLFTAVFLTGCYTQLETVDRRVSDGYYPTTQRAAPERRAPVEERADEIENVEDYELGYEDGWVDAEAFYFVDEEARDWYLEHGASLAHTNSRPYSANYMRPYDPDWFYSPYHYYTYYGVPHWRHGFSIHFGWSRPWGYFGFGSHFAYNRFYYGGLYDYGYYRYPFYDPFYYGGYWSGWYGYYNRPIVIYNNNIVSNRNYSARSTGLASSRRSTINRTRPDINSSRSAVRANARSSRIDSRSAARSTVRSRGTTSTRSSVGSRSTGRTTNRGTVNRSGSSSRGSSGSVGRTRSNNRSSGSSVNRSRSNNNRSSGSSVSRSSSNRSSGSSVNRSSGSSSRSSGSSASRSRSNNQQAAAVQSSSRSDVRSDVRSSIISGKGNSAIIRRGEAANRESTSRTIRTERSSERSLGSASARESVLNRAISGQRSTGLDTERLRPVSTPARSVSRLSREPARSGSGSFGRVLLRGATKAASSVLREAAGSRTTRSSSVGRSSSRSSSGSSAVRSSGSSSRSSGVSRSSGRSGSSRESSSSSRSRSSSRNN